MKKSGLSLKLPTAKFRVNLAKLIKYVSAAFLAIMIAGLSFSVYLVSNSLQGPKEKVYTDEQKANTIKAQLDAKDKQNADILDDLKTSSDQEGAEPGLPSGVRTNPFSE